MAPGPAAIAAVPVLYLMLKRHEKAAGDPGRDYTGGP